jgi:hypothetical protein
MIVTLRGKCMGEFFQCDTEEILPLHSYLKVSGKECFVNGYIDNGVLTIIKVLWTKELLE